MLSDEEEEDNEEDSSGSGIDTLEAEQSGSPSSSGVSDPQPAERAGTSTGGDAGAIDWRFEPQYISLGCVHAYDLDPTGLLSW